MGEKVFEYDQTLFEDGKVLLNSKESENISEYKSQIPWSRDEIAEAEAEIKRLRLDEKEEDFILKIETCQHETYLKSKQHVGVFYLGKRTIQVLPKMYKAGSGVSERQAKNNLIYMLGYINKLDIKQHTISSLLEQDLNFFEVLVRLFATNLLEQWRKGAFRCYQSVNDTLPVLKGKLNLTEQLRHPEQKHLFSVTYDEFTADNQLNQILRHVVERLWKLTKNNKNKQLLNDLRQLMNEVTLLPSVNIPSISRIPFTRLNLHYQPILKLAQLFLMKKSFELDTGKVEVFSFAFMFDMNVLFEKFVISFIERNRNEIFEDLENCKSYPQADKIEKHMGIKTSNNKSNKNERVFKIKPDLVIEHDNSYPFIIDTKYKKLKKDHQNLGVDEKDFYQMYAYAQCYNCPRVLLIYPQCEDTNEPLQATFKIQSNFESGKRDRTIIAATINLRGDLSKQDEKDKLLNRLKELLQY